MSLKTEEKEVAICLRKKGLSYNEILQKVNVSKSTLSLWLRDVGLATVQKQQLTEKRKLAQHKAQEACRNARIERETITIASAKNEITPITKNELWLIGITLYWAEGSKQKKNNVSQKVSFNNSDPKMILIFDQWLRKICGKKTADLTYSIYIHHTGDKEKSRKFWEKLLHTKIEKMYFKTHQPKTNRKNINEDYHGLLRIDVKKSTNLNRKLKGWALGIVENMGK